MSYTELKFGEDAREVLRAGAEKVYKAVSSTLGAKGRNVVRQNFGRPKITNDGVTIARAIELKDPFEKQGADLIKEAAEKTVQQAGDGTTTAITLAYEAFSQGLELIKNGENPVVLKTYLEKETERVLHELKEMAIPVTSDEDLERVATISVENPEYGKIIAKAVKTVGKDGLVVVQEDGSKLGIHAKEISGYQFDRGLENPYLVTNLEKMEAVLESENGRPVFVLVADKQWNLIGDLLPLFNEIKASGGDKILIIAESISGELMQFITVNRLKQRFHAVVVSCPFNKDTLEDIAALTGATAITANKGIVEVKLSHCGQAKRIVVTGTTTTIIDGAGDASHVIEALRKQVEEAEDYDKEKLQQRLAKLTGVNVELSVGAPTEAETKYLRDKLDDAVAATRAAVEEGIVPGGGMALARISQKFFEKSDDKNREFIGTILVSPLVKIMENAGITEEESAELAGELKVNEESGFDALRGKIVPDIIEAGIIDPVKVTRCAFKNAMSLAAMLLTCDTVMATREDT